MKNAARQTMNKQTGFTLIELVVVIVILGILAVTAAPKFIDLQGDARGAVINGVKAAVETANTGVHAKSLIAGNDNALKAANQSVNVNDEAITIGSGWALATVDNFNNLLDLDENDFDMAVAGTKIVISQDQDPDLTLTEVEATNCYVSYTESADSNVKPDIEAVITGC